MDWAGGTREGGKRILFLLRLMPVWPFNKHFPCAAQKLTFLHIDTTKEPSFRIVIIGFYFGWSHWKKRRIPSETRFSPPSVVLALKLILNADLLGLRAYMAFEQKKKIFPPDNHNISCVTLERTFFFSSNNHFCVNSSERPREMVNMRCASLIHKNDFVLFVDGAITKEIYCVLAPKRI